MKLGDLFPDFKATTDRGNIESFYDWIGEDNWAVLFSHPADFTPVCTTELARAAKLAKEFTSRKVRMLALSCDSVQSHKEWIKDIVGYANDDNVTNASFPFEIVADEGRVLATQLGMLDPIEKDRTGLPLTARAVFIVDPAKTLSAQILYPATTGRNFDEILRVIDSLQLTRRKSVATPENWVAGDDCMVQPSVNESEALLEFGNKLRTIDVPSGKKYLRLVPQP